MRTAPLACALLAAFAACSQGGDEQKTLAEVKLAANHHMVGLGGAARYAGYPIPETTKYARSDTLAFDVDGFYQLQSLGSASRHRYLLSKNGDLIIEQLERRPDLRLPGYYDIAGDTHFFVSRILNTPFVFFSVKEQPGVAKVEGKWSVLGETLVFAPKSSTPSAARVGRAFAGQLSLAATGTIEAGSSWKDSAGNTVVLSGLAKAGSKGALDLAVTGGPWTGSRTFAGGVGKQFALLVDSVASNGQIGLCALMREMTTAFDKTKVVGSWRVAVHTIFNNPASSGTDVAFGTLTLAASGSFDLAITGLNGRPFRYKGSYAATSAGRLDFTVTTPAVNDKQVWKAAVTSDYRNLVIADTTTGRNFEVGLVLAVKRP